VSPLIALIEGLHAQIATLRYDAYRAQNRFVGRVRRARRILKKAILIAEIPVLALVEQFVPRRKWYGKWTPAERRRK
jgi:hypothetical protein